MLASAPHGAASQHCVRGILNHDSRLGRWPLREYPPALMPEYGKCGRHIRAPSGPHQSPAAGGSGPPPPPTRGRRPSASGGPAAGRGGASRGRPAWRASGRPSSAPSTPAAVVGHGGMGGDAGGEGVQRRFRSRGEKQNAEKGRGDILHMRKTLITLVNAHNTMNAKNNAWGNTWRHKKNLSAIFGSRKGPFPFCCQHFCPSRHILPGDD